MHIKKGSNRFVFVFPTVGLVVKLPRIHLLIFLRSLFRCAPGGKLWEIKRQLSYSTEVYGSWNRMLFKGIKDNWSEFQFYQQTRHIAVEPTYFSFFGFFNIQRYGKSEKIKDSILSRALIPIVGEEVLLIDSHHFANSNNFSFRGKKFRFRDYGSYKTQCVIDDHGYKIFKEVDVEKLIEEQKLLKK